jgi:hypothetical protein
MAGALVVKADALGAAHPKLAGRDEAPERTGPFAGLDRLEESPRRRIDVVEEPFEQRLRQPLDLRETATGLLDREVEEEQVVAILSLFPQAVEQAERAVAFAEQLADPPVDRGRA